MTDSARIADIGNTPYLTDASFSIAFDRFCKAIEAESGQAFRDFGSGLPDDWEGYKEWVYHEGRRTLEFDRWKKTDLGKGSILEAAIAAIELHSSSRYRNNLVQWDARFGEEGRSHKALLDARHDRTATKQVEQMLYSLYRGQQSDEAGVFAALVTEVGKRYDLLAYLFFLKDWSRFMPMKPSKFSEAFDLLGIPHLMVGKCSWDNYQGYLKRLSLVRQKLSEFQVPGNRLIDAHSFCWILVSLWGSNIRQSKPEWVHSTPKAALRPASTAQSSNGANEKTAEDYLNEARAKQTLGALAQSIVLHAEVRRLKQQGKEKLAKQVRDVSVNPSLGYDIESYELDGSPKRIEVKAASSNKSHWRFYLSQNELDKSKQLDGYVFALVDRVHTAKPRIWEFPAKQLPKDALHTVTYQVYLETP